MMAFMLIDMRAGLRGEERRPGAPSRSAEAAACAAAKGGAGFIICTGGDGSDFVSFLIYFEERYRRALGYSIRPDESEGGVETGAGKALASG